jgi:hypothetical protein
MKTISQMFDSAFATKESRDWEKIYVLVDIHQTILFPTWSEERSEVYYPMAKECLQLLSQRNDVCLIQWSSSSQLNNAKYHHSFHTEGIDFNYINYNPEVKSTEYADFDSKPYMNIIIDDKGGFEPEVDWLELHEYLINKNNG